MILVSFSLRPLSGQIFSKVFENCTSCTSIRFIGKTHVLHRIMNIQLVLMTYKLSFNTLISSCAQEIVKCGMCEMSVYLRSPLCHSALFFAISLGQHINSGTKKFHNYDSINVIRF